MKAYCGACHRIPRTVDDFNRDAAGGSRRYGIGQTVALFDTDLQSRRVLSA
jgi:hypothetical protein